MIEELLSIGIENAQTAKELAQLTGKAERLITRQIVRERRAGAPILAKNTGKIRGYYLTENPEEIEEYCRRIHHRAGEMFKTRRELLKVAERMRDGKSDN